jgi:hypothetical protein
MTWFGARHNQAWVNPGKTTKRAQLSRREAAMGQPSVTPEPFTLGGPPPGQAKLLWEWSYTADGIVASGTLTSASQPSTGGYFQISAITGWRNGNPITSLEPAGEAIPGNQRFPVDNLISAKGSLTSNGFGYETATGGFANPFFADFLNPQIYEEVFTQPAFSEVPVQFQAHRVPGVTVATVVPARPGDALSLMVIQAPRSGTVSLHGTSVQYIPASRNPRTPVTFSFDLKGQSGSTTPVISVIAAGNGPHRLTGAASGYTDISLGNGNNTINLSGSNNSVTLGAGTDTVRGGNGDTINIAGNTRLAVYGTDEMVFIGEGNAAIKDFSTGLQVKIGPGTGHVDFSGFASDPGCVIDLMGGVGGLADAASVMSALVSDGRGGTQLSFGNGQFLDLVGVARSQLHAMNFHVG